MVVSLLVLVDSCGGFAVFTGFMSVSFGWFILTLGGGVGGWVTGSNVNQTNSV